VKVLAAVKVTVNGRISLTQPVLDALKLAEGDFVKLVQTDSDNICIEKA
jgi:bifunctional DNA-binding transcriptional regulator/antitoxin component of YhaV-PrlF toxin-antitoxin module